MNLDYAVERLYEAGWKPTPQCEQESLPDGRRYPSIIATQREFTRVGLELQIKHNLMFNCYYAIWGPAGHPMDPDREADEAHGTVIGACAREAAVYALAQLRESRVDRQLAMA
jgi:hypothetical protein